MDRRWVAILAILAVLVLGPVLLLLLTDDGQTAERLEPIDHEPGASTMPTPTDVPSDVRWAADLEADLARQPAVGPPIGGGVIYVEDDGNASFVRRVEIVPDAGDEVFAQLPEVVWDMAIAPDGSVAYLAIVDRKDTEVDLGVVRVALDGSGNVEPLMEPALVAGTGAQG